LDHKIFFGQVKRKERFTYRTKKFHKSIPRIVVGTDSVTYQDGEKLKSPIKKKIGKIYKLAVRQHNEGHKSTSHHGNRPETFLIFFYFFVCFVF
jgi:hypothetical protein